MGARRSIHVAGLDHVAQPIPVAVAGGGWVFSSPVGPRPLGGGSLPATLAQQIELTFSNLRRVLDAAKVTPDDVMFVRVFVADLADRAEFNIAWAEFFGPDGPARQVTENSLPEGARVLLRFTAIDRSTQER